MCLIAGGGACPVERKEIPCKTYKVYGLCIESPFVCLCIRAVVMFRTARWRPTAKLLGICRFLKLFSAQKKNILFGFIPSLENTILYVYGGKRIKKKHSFENLYYYLYPNWMYRHDVKTSRHIEKWYFKSFIKHVYVYAKIIEQTCSVNNNVKKDTIVYATTVFFYENIRFLTLDVSAVYQNENSLVGRNDIWSFSLRFVVFIVITTVRRILNPSLFRRRRRRQS